MDVTCEALYALYGECFPCYPLSREWFFSLLALEQGNGGNLCVNSTISA